MQLTSSAFQTGGAIPARYTSDGGDISPDSPGRKPQIERSHLFLSRTTRTLPEPVDLRIWVVYNIPPSLGSAAENVPKQELVASLGLQGKNDGGKVGYVGPCPPSGKHRYFFGLFALDKELDLPPGASHQQVTSAMENHQLGVAELMGTYARKSERAA